MWSGKINVPTVPVLFRGLVKTNYELQELCLSFMGEKEFQIDEREGIVIRLSKEFDNINFDFSTGKMVRANHVQTSDHWKDQEIIRNKLKI